MLPVQHKVENPPDGSVGQESLLVQMHDPVIIRQVVDVFFEAVLQGPGLEHGARFGAVGGGDYNLEIKKGIMMKIYIFLWVWVHS